MSNTLKYAILGIVGLGLAIFAFSYFNGASANKDSKVTAISADNTAKDVTTAAADQAKSLDAANQNKIDVVPTGPTTVMSFKEKEFDFGNIEQNTTNEHIFKFTNTGLEPLIIADAKGSCGCTVPEYPKEPIPPGESGEIKVVYKPGKQKNKQTKKVTVTANTEPAQSILTITAEVEVDEEAEAAAAAAGTPAK